MSKEIDEEVGAGAISGGPSTNTSSVPDPSNIGYKKRDKRRKHDIDHMYRRNLVDKATSILKRKKANKIEESKSSYAVYHNTFTSAIDAALKYAEKQGYTYDKEETADKIGMGPKKPSKGKTNKYTITLMKNGKPQKKALQIQVYNRGTSSNEFELNCYIA